MEINENYMNFKKISETETELYIYGSIRKKDIFDIWLGTGKEKTEAYTLKDALAKVDTPNLIVRINSDGGEVSEGLAIYALLSTFNGYVKTIVDGFACSIASVIFMAGEERVVPENGLLMIHNAWASVSGDSNDMKKYAEDLEKITQPTIDIYKLKTGLAEETIKEMMDKETWITSKEAYELGFSTTMTRNDESMQMIGSKSIYKLVMENKRLNNELKMRKKLEKNNLPKEDALASFFNGK